MNVVLIVVSSLILWQVLRFLFVVFRLGHMDERYRDQVKWAWQERRHKKLLRRDARIRGRDPR